jgi:hypothetical protein
MAFTAVTLTGHYEDEHGIAVSGSVTLQLTYSMYQPGVANVARTPITLTLDGSGNFSTTLLATNDTATEPVDVAYQVTERVGGAPEFIYYIQLDHSTSPIDIASCQRVLPTEPPPFVLQGSTGPPGPQGATGATGATGAQGPPGAGASPAQVVAGAFQDGPARSSVSRMTVFDGYSTSPLAGLTIDMAIGDSIIFGQGVHNPAINNSGIGITDFTSLLSNWENWENGLPANYRGFHAVYNQGGFWGPPYSWSSVAIAGSPVASTVGPNTLTSMNLNGSGGIVGDTRVFRRAFVILAKQSSGGNAVVAVSLGNYACVATNGTTTLTLTDVTGLHVGDNCASGPGITTGCPITGITNNVVTISGATGTLTTGTYTFNTNSGTISTGGTGYVIADTGDLGSAQLRTLEVIQTSGTSSPNVVVVGAIYVQSDGTKGHVLVNVAQGGSLMQWWAGGGSTPYPGWQALLTLLQPRRLYIAAGINDLNTGRTVSQLQTDITTVVQDAIAAAPLTEIDLIAPYRGGSPCSVSAAAWPTVQAAYAAVAAANNCVFLDLMERIGDISSTPASGSADPYGLSDGDFLHPSDFAQSSTGADGHRSIANYIASRLPFDNQPAPVAPADGWNAAPNNWTHVSSFVFTVSSPINLTHRYTTGTKLRWAESGVIKYGVVASSVFSTGSGGVTTVTMANTDDYSMAANPDLNSNWFSLLDPLGFPPYFKWTPSWSGNGSGGTIVAFSHYGSDGWADVSIVTVVAPSAGGTSVSLSNLPIQSTISSFLNTIYCLDGIGTKVVQVQVTSGSTTVNFNAGGTSAGWAGSAIHQVAGSFRYPYR